MKKIIIGAASAALVAGSLVLGTPEKAFAQDVQTVCNSSASDYYVVTSNTAHETLQTVWTGQCRTFLNFGGRGRIQIEAAVRSYKQGRDGIGWEPCVNKDFYSTVWSNPINNPPGGINRYKTYSKSNCQD